MSNERIPCPKCSTMILPVTAKFNDGLCPHCNWERRIEEDDTQIAEERKRRWPKGIVTVDLAADRKEIRSYFDHRIASFKGDPKKVSAIAIGFNFNQSGWVSLHFDTREVYETDGDWTKRLGPENTISFPAWEDLVAAEVDDDPGRLILLDGREIKLKEGEGLDWAKNFGETILSVVQSCTRDGKWDRFGSSLIIAIEDFDGAWAWGSPEN